MISNKKFYKDKVSINLLARNIENAVDVVEALDGYTIIGVLSKDFNNVEEAVSYINEMKKSVPSISVGLGAGDPNQWKMAADIAKQTDPGHVNQVFSTAGYTQGLLDGTGCTNTFANALISPSGEIGKVIVSTGPLSSVNETIVDVDEALLLLKDCNVKSVKFFNMGGLKHLDELREVAAACVRNDIPIIEPTGGMSADNIYEIVRVCVEAGCEKVIPHVYSSAIDKETGLTDIEIVKKLYDEIKKVF